MVLFISGIALILLGIANKIALSVFAGFGILFILGISLWGTGITVYTTNYQVQKIGTDSTITALKGTPYNITTSDDDSINLLANLLIYGSIVGMAISIGFTKIHEDETILDYARKRLGG